MTSRHDFQVLGLCGSLRTASLNRAALAMAGELMPAGMRLQFGSFAQLPFYSSDEQDKGWPPGLRELGDAVTQADAVLIACPEYNFSIPGAFKNALDWLSRLPSQPFKNKPVALFGVAPGPVGTARMQYELRRVLHYLEARVLSRPEIFIGNSGTKFNGEGRLIDETALQLIRDQMHALRRLIVRERAAAEAERQFQ